MKPKKHKETDRTIEETPSNNRDTNKTATEVCDLKVSSFDSGIANDKSRMCSTSKAGSRSWLNVGFTLEDFSLFT